MKTILISSASIISTMDVNGTSTPIVLAIFPDDCIIFSKRLYREGRVVLALPWDSQMFMTTMPLVSFTSKLQMEKDQGKEEELPAHEIL